MKKRVVFMCILSAILCAQSAFASDEIGISLDSDKVTVTPTYEGWENQPISVLIFSKSDRENNEIEEKDINETNFAELVVYADVLDKPQSFTYLMRDDDISGDYKVSISLADGSEIREESYYYAAKADRDRILKEITAALGEEDISKLKEIFAREGRDCKILNSLGCLTEEYAELSEESREKVLKRFKNMNNEDLAARFNEAVIVEKINTAAADTIEQELEKYKDKIGIKLEENDNFKKLRSKTSFFTAFADTEFESFDAICASVNSVAALCRVNDEGSYTEIYGILKENDDVFNISFADYDQLNDYYKSVVLKAMVGNNFKSADEVKAKFEKESKDALAKQKDSESKSNSSTGGSSKGGSGGGGGGVMLGDVTVKPDTGKDDDKKDENKKDDENPEVKDEFTDLESVEWAKSAISALYEKGIVAGDGEGKFDPSRNIKREEFVKMIVLAFGIEPKTGTNEFSDCIPGAWYEEYINAGVDAGLIKGVSAEEFGVGRNITREDMAVIVARAMKLDISAESEKFTDDDEISDYAKDAVYAVKEKGVISGLGDGRFAPKMFATRAQAAKIIYMGMGGDI